MCFYVYSPAHTILLRHVSEKVRPIEKFDRGLKRAGTSLITVDLIITIDHEAEGSACPSDDAISRRDSSLCGPTLPFPSQVPELDKFFIVYPNKLYTCDMTLGDAQISRGIRFDDGTAELMRELEDAQGKGGAHFRSVLDDQFVQFVDTIQVKRDEDNEQDYDIKLHLPNPNSLEMETLQSYARGVAKVRPVSNGTIPGVPFAALYTIMEKSKATILECTLDRPIKPGEHRWIRFVIGPASTSRTAPKGLFKWGSHVFFNQNSYRYEIKGPYNVRYEFSSNVSSALTTMGSLPLEDTKRDNKDDYEHNLDAYVGKLKEYLGKIEAHMGERIRSKYEDWRLIVIGNQGEISGIREYGIYKISGSLFERVSLKSKDKTREEDVYTWKTGWINVCPEVDVFPSMCRVSSRRQGGGEIPTELPVAEPDGRIIITEKQTALDPDIGEFGKSGRAQCRFHHRSTCIPFTANFKIAYDWTRNYNPVQVILILAFLYGIISPLNSIIRFGLPNTAHKLQYFGANAPAPLLVDIQGAPCELIENYVVREIRNAKKDVLVRVGTLLPHAIASTLTEAHNRGVNVVVLLDRTSPEQAPLASFLKYSDIPTFKTEKQGSQEITMLIDGALSVTGPLTGATRIGSQYSNGALTIRHDVARTKAALANFNTLIRDAVPYEAR